MPEEIDKQIAKLKLESMGVQIDKLTPEQEHYLASWSEGTYRRSSGLAPVTQELCRPDRTGVVANAGMDRSGARNGARSRRHFRRRARGGHPPARSLHQKRPGGHLSEGESLGLGMRVIANGSWGFASTDRLTREGVQACAAQAVAIARASALAKLPRRLHGARAGLRGHLAESLHQRPLCHSARAPARPAAGRRPRDEPRQGRYHQRDLHAVSPHRAVVRLHHRLAHPSGENAVRRGNRGHEFRRQRNPEALLSQQLRRPASARPATS